MTNEQIRRLCLCLMKADSETEVIDALSRAGYWDDTHAWRYYGDYENNYNTIGNQQSRPDAALVEKLVNSVDARLMCECYVRGVDPEGPTAPRTIREAVATFFEGNPDPKRDTAGRIKLWSDSRRTEVAKGITLAATGYGPSEGNPCLTISDSGEGQTPDMVPHTLLSLTRSNKLRIPFVQGKFNMGGTGVLKFCGRHNLELIVTKRHPNISCQSIEPVDRMWSFTVVRREDPHGNRRSSVYTYLAPVGSDQDPGIGSVLRFDADSMPIFPEGRNAYGRESEWGTLIKLYEYQSAGYSKTHILMKGGLLHRVDLLLPDVALPVRLYECRSQYRGHGGSFETNVTGLGVRLEEDRGANLELGFPSPSKMTVYGETMAVTVYAFTRDRAETYRKNEGLIFTLNGQTHGYLTSDFFRRKKVGLGYLADHLLVMVDCSSISGRAREDLFMNSRDRLSTGELREAIERSLEDLLKNHQGLRDLQEQRRREEIAEKIVDTKPLETILESLLKKSPTLSALFLEGTRLSSPFKTVKAKVGEGSCTYRRFPTYFRFRNLDYGRTLQRECHINNRCRIQFDTDAAEEYFRREEHPGEFRLFRTSGDGVQIPVNTYTLNGPHNGVATLSVELPENCQVGDKLEFLAEVVDYTRIEPFNNKFIMIVHEAADANPGSGGPRTPPGRKGDSERVVPSGIALPRISNVTEEDWSRYGFDRYSALGIVNAGMFDENPNGPSIYDFKVNVDNIYLKSELKSTSHDKGLLIARFRLAMVLLGLALIHDDNQKAKTREKSDVSAGDNEVASLEGRVASVTSALAPVLLPMIESLGNLDAETTAALAGIGEAV